jgi:peptidoglycan/xylan/chitin deacetylase (PgdA/CDA1 family)
LIDEVAGSKNILETITRKRVEWFAYPTGNYDRRVAQAVQDAGYRAAFAVDALGIAPAQYEIPRLGLYASDPAYLSLKLSGLYQPYIRQT